MIHSCTDVRARIEDLAADALPARERTAVRDHLATCAACRADAAAADPVLVFASPRAPEVSPEETAQILTAVRSAIAVQSAERRLGHARGSRRLGAAAAVAAVLVFALSVAGDRSRRSEPAAAPPARAAVEERAPAALAPAARPGPAPAATVPADATIYDWNPGGGQPRVVWIVDGSLDI